ncbi:MAG TPA: multicopper oxidase domain-containing protein [Anaeromyxobacter sp.]|nr:multicopper oxidase domain-containing protein [Anaeromyxobacter sp.]
MGDHPPDVHGQSQSHTRTYYIAAEEVEWDFAPRGRNLTGSPSPEGDEASAPPRYLKAVYREYTDGTFRKQKERPAGWEHLGILGPLIRAEVGDRVHVLFRNNTKLTVTMHPHGLQYEKNAEGAPYEDGTSGADKKDDGVPPGGTYTYRWTVPERSGPGPHDPSSVVWMYHSHFYEPRDVNTGLIGPIIVTRKGWARPDGTPKDVDREFVTDFAIFDETESWYFEANMKGQRAYSPDLSVIDPVFRSRNLFYSINGYIDGNLPTPVMKRGERVRWYFLANSNEDDVHTPHWHGATALVNNMRTDTVSLTPMSMVVADMVPEDVGTWLFHCHVNEHLQRGMVARYTVLP